MPAFIVAVTGAPPPYPSTPGPLPPLSPAPVMADGLPKWSSGILNAYRRLQAPLGVINMMAPPPQQHSSRRRVSFASAPWSRPTLPLPPTRPPPQLTYCGPDPSPSPNAPQHSSRIVCPVPSFPPSPQRPTTQLTYSCSYPSSPFLFTPQPTAWVEWSAPPHKGEAAPLSSMSFSLYVLRSTSLLSTDPPRPLSSPVKHLSPCCGR